MTSDQRTRPVRTRFAPSPTGDLHVGNVRTALYAWAYARRTGGTFVFRVEDTDRSRVTDEAIASAAEDLRWLGLTWDEGIEVGGDYGPYRCSERLSLYAEWVGKFLASGVAYHCYCSPDELDAEREAQRAAGEPPGYSGRCRSLTREQIAAYEREGRQPVVRFRMPEGRTIVRDLVHGEIEFDHVTIPDFVIMRASGFPLYNLAVAVDDALMQITHVVRGDDLLSSTPRQLAIYRVMGIPDDQLPTFAHLPYVLSADGKALSKRHGSESLSWYREHGYLPEAVVNYLALLGWSPGGDREDLTLTELGELFTLERVNANAARLDEKKLDAINGGKIRALDVDDLAERLRPFLIRAGVMRNEPTDAEMMMLRSAAPLIRERLVRLDQAADMISFLFAPDDVFTVEPEAAARVLSENSRPVLEAAEWVLESLAVWEHERIEQVLRQALVEELGLKPRNAFGPVRVATSGRRVSPPLFESLELLGRERTLNRIRRALAEHVGV